MWLREYIDASKSWLLCSRFESHAPTSFLKVNRRQFKCTPCGKPFSEDLDFVGRKRKHTDRFSEMVALQVIHSSSHNVAQKHDLSDDEVWSIVQYVSKKNSSLNSTDLND